MGVGIVAVGIRYSYIDFYLGFVCIYNVLVYPSIFTGVNL